MIELVDNHSVTIFIEPDHLRRIADSLEIQQKRHEEYMDGKQKAPMMLESLYCQLHSKNVSVWFRLPPR